jgi:hypothetical protein
MDNDERQALIAAAQAISSAAIAFGDRSKEVELAIKNLYRAIEETDHSGVESNEYFSHVAMRLYDV